MDEKIKAAVEASFIADSLALGVHWIYNTNVIDKKYGRVDRFLKPKLASFHRGKEAGEFTHYGDQTLVLLESVAHRSKFELEDFSHRWQSMFEGYTGYFDGATKGTLENFSQGKPPTEAGSGSSDLGGAARIAPLLLVHGKDARQLSETARLQTAMTHNHPQVVQSADFFARVVFSVLNGASPVSAVREVGNNLPADDPLREMIDDGLMSTDQDSRTAISDFGQMCEIEAAFPATLHLIARYEADFKSAMIENVMAGGDSSARGMLVGMVLGAWHGYDAVPGEWRTDLVQHDHILSLMDKV